MTEQQLAALAAAFGESDPDKIVAAAASLKIRADGAEQSLAQMTAERATLAARAEAAERRSPASSHASGRRSKPLTRVSTAARTRPSPSSAHTRSAARWRLPPPARASATSRSLVVHEV